MIWYGQRDFGSGEPRVVLVRSAAFPLLWVVVGIIALAIFVGAVLWFKKARHPLKKEEIIPIEEITKTDMERTVDLLKNANGKLYQSDIMKKSGFSKPKTSLLLKSMEEAGMIERIRMGRKNLVVLKNQVST